MTNFTSFMHQPRLWDNYFIVLSLFLSVISLDLTSSLRISVAAWDLTSVLFCEHHWCDIGCIQTCSFDFLLVVRTSWCLHSLIIGSIAEEGFLLSLGCSSLSLSIHLTEVFHPSFSHWVSWDSSEAMWFSCYTVIPFFDFRLSLLYQFLFLLLVYANVCFLLFFYVYFYTDSSFLLPTSALGNHIASWVDFGPVFGVAFR